MKVKQLINSLSKVNPESDIEMEPRPLYVDSLEQRINVALTQSKVILRSSYHEREV